MSAARQKSASFFTLTHSTQFLCWMAASSKPLAPRHTKRRIRSITFPDCPTRPSSAPNSPSPSRFSACHELPTPPLRDFSLHVHHAICFRAKNNSYFNLETRINFLLFGSSENQPRHQDKKCGGFTRSSQRSKNRCQRHSASGSSRQRSRHNCKRSSAPYAFSLSGQRYQRPPARQKAGSVQPGTHSRRCKKCGLPAPTRRPD